MGIDLELADCAAAAHRRQACRESSPVCVHDPECELNYDRVVAGAAVERPGESCPSKFRYRRFGQINGNMQLTGMGYRAEPDWESFAVDRGSDPRLIDEADVRRRAQTVARRRGIPAFKLESNDRWLVTVREIDEAFAAYAVAPAELRERLETDERWVAWLQWLAVARNHDGFESE